jgi:hypothetical protein
MAMWPYSNAGKEKGQYSGKQAPCHPTYDVDFNFTNKTIFSRCMMFFAEDRAEVADKCSGSHSFHDALEVALNHRLFLRHHPSEMMFSCNQLCRLETML